MTDSTTPRGPKPSSLVAFTAVIVGCALLQGSATVWSTALLMVGCVLAFAVGWTARASVASEGGAPMPLRLVEGDDAIDQARAALDRAQTSERAMDDTLADLDRMIESVEELCVTLDEDLAEQESEAPPLRKGA